jgi:hypothetical protein
MDRTTWSVYSVTDIEAALSEVKLDSGQLNGAAHDGIDYYIATSKGIYNAASPNSVVTGSAGNVVGILDVEKVITVVTRGGQILVLKEIVDEETMEKKKTFQSISSRGPTYTGAMSVWKEYENGEKTGKSLLLLGIEGKGNYNNGYRELTLGSDGKPIPSSPAIPGTGNPSSLKPDDKRRYEASLARYNVYYILQVPIDIDPREDSTGWQPLVFASTSKNGVWVLNRVDGWNAVPKKN